MTGLAGCFFYLEYDRAGPDVLPDPDPVLFPGEPGRVVVVVRDGDGHGRAGLQAPGAELAGHQLRQKGIFLYK